MKVVGPEKRWGMFVIPGNVLARYAATGPKSTADGGLDDAAHHFFFNRRQGEDDSSSSDRWWEWEADEES